MDPEYQANPTPTIYDITVPAPDTLRAKIIALMQDPAQRETLKELASLNDQLAILVQSLTTSKARHSFFTTMSKDPVNFVKKWVSSQKKDLEIIMGDARAGNGAEWMGDEFRRGGSESVWSSENVRESVGLMVSKRA